jgi:hypothetical protein
MHAKHAILLSGRTQSSVAALSGAIFRLIGWMIVGVATTTPSGCKPNDGLALSPAPANAPSAGQIIAAHNQRVGKLATTCSRGVIEVRWRDERGKHQHQGDLDFYRAPGDCTALSITKVGERLFWLGSNRDEFWLFDLSNRDDRVLYRGTHNTAAGATAIPALQAFGVRPHDLLLLLALQPLAEPSDVDARPAYDSRRKAYVLEDSRVRTFFDRSTLLPVRVELLDAGSTVLAESDHARFQTVEMPGVALLARPKMAELVDIRQAKAVGGGEEEVVDVEVKIAINDTTTVVDPKQLQRVFDLEALIRSLQPDRVESAAGQ